MTTAYRNPRLEKLRQQMRDLDCSQFTVKVADMGGGQDMPFEQAFGNLAHAYLQDKAPALLDYEVGFQLVDRNQESTKAVGVFGFKVGDKWLYAPIFFVNGDMKGHDLLYLKDQDLFVPLQENWLNYIMNRKPSVLGEGVDKDLTQLGVQPPNLYQVTRSPAKYAGDKRSEIEAILAMRGHNKMAKWVLDVLPDLAYFATTSPLHDEKYAGIRNALDVVKLAGDRGVKALALHCQYYPELQATLDEVYGAENIDAAVKEAASRYEPTSILDHGAFKLVDGKLTDTRSPSPADLITKQAEDDDDDGKGKSKGRASVHVISYTRVMELGRSPTKGTTIDYDSDDKSSLLKGEMKIKDERPDEDVSVAFDIDIPQKLQSPSETGLYEVLTKPGEFKKCLVVFGPYSAKGRKTFCTVVDTESGAWTNAHNSEIWTKTHYQRELFEKWYKDKDKGSVGDGQKLIILPTGQATLPFHSHEDVDAGDLDAHDVCFSECSSKVRAGSLPQRIHPEGEPLSEGPGSLCHCGQKIVFTGREGTALKAMGKELLVPKEHKVVTLKRGYSDEGAVLQLGTLVDFQMGLIKSGELQQIDLRHTGSTVRINGGREMTEQNSLVALVVDHGFREKQARDMLDIAKEKKAQRFLVKYAAKGSRRHHQGTWELQRSAPGAPPFPEPTIGADPMTGGQVPTLPVLEASIPVPGMQAMVYDRSVYDPRPGMYSQPHMVDSSSPRKHNERSKRAADEGVAPPDQKTVETAMQAAQSGQKEVFDTAMIGSLLKSVRDDSMIDQFKPDLMKGMDRLGRILFMYYWHKDEFEDRYGKEDLPELEDGLRNAFESVGNVILFLLQKGVEGQPGSSDIDLHSVAY